MIPSAEAKALWYSIFRGRRNCRCRLVARHCLGSNHFAGEMDRSTTGGRSCSRLAKSGGNRDAGGKTFCRRARVSFRPPRHASRIGRNCLIHPIRKADSSPKTALQAERQYQLVKAEEGLFKAQQKLTEVLSSSKASDEKARRTETARSRRHARTLNRTDGVGATQQGVHADCRAVPENEHRAKVGSGSLDGESGQPADSSRRHQPPLDAALWKTHRANCRQFRTEREAPSHPELLDWWRAELMEKNWSMKRFTA